MFLNLIDSTNHGFSMLVLFLPFEEILSEEGRLPGSARTYFSPLSDVATELSWLE